MAIRQKVTVRAKDHPLLHTDAETELEVWRDRRFIGMMRTGEESIELHFELTDEMGRHEDVVNIGPSPVPPDPAEDEVDDSGNVVTVKGFYSPGIPSYSQVMSASIPGGTTVAERMSEDIGIIYQLIQRMVPGAAGEQI